VWAASSKSITTEAAEDTEDMSFVDDAVNAGPEYLNIEIDQQAEADAHEF
jgi:hypothetical protein